LKKEQRKQITLWRSPVKTLRIFLFSVITAHLSSLVKYLLKHKIALSVISSSILLGVVFYVLPGSHQLTVRRIEESVLLMIWWVGLGILSSVGLGTGLHTFVLYLGPFIAKTTLVATECNSLDFETYGPNSFICPQNVPIVAITMWEILRKIQFEAFLWGAGTAIGELPPYFVARAARLSGERLKDHEDLEEERNSGQSLSDRLKNFMTATLDRFGFFGHSSFCIYSKSVI